MRYTLCIISLLSLLAVTGYAQDKQYSKAFSEYQNGNFSAAHTRLNKMSSLDRKSKLLLVNVLYQMQKYERIQSLLAGLENLDDNARVALAMSYHTNQQYEEARVTWRTLLNDEDRAVVLNNIGDTFSYTSDFDSSLYYFEKALEIDPLNSGFLLNIGLVHAANEKSDKACAYFFLASELGEPSGTEEYENGNCISWQQQWAHLIPGNHVSQLSNNLFPGLDQTVLTVGEKFVMKNESGVEYEVVLTDFNRTGVGVSIGYQRKDKSIEYTWVRFDEKVMWSLAPKH